jgi:tetratricopeptide (TPR) repeat protein
MLRRLAPLALFLALLLPIALSGAEAPPYPISPAETEAAKLMEDGRFTLAKEKARAILTVDRGSFVALFVLGAAYYRADGNLPKARFFLRRAQEVLERRWGRRMNPDEPWRWHARVLGDLVHVAGEMDDRKEQLKLLRLHDELYSPKATAAYGWPLMKLGRMEEGRRKLEQALMEGNPDARLTALNTLGAMENESGNSEKAYEVFGRLVEEVQQKKLPMDPVFLRNWGSSAMAVGRYDEGEKLFLESARFFQTGTFTNPWKDLAELYLAQGRFPESLSAVREMQAWAHRNLPAMDQQSWAGRQTVVAALLAECGFIQEATKLAGQVRDRPDRKGGSSSQGGQAEAGDLIHFRYLLNLRGQILEEEAAWAPLRDWPRLAWERVQLRSESWAARERAAALTVQNGWLAASLKPHSYNAVECMGWAVPELVEVVGPGVAGDQARRLLDSGYRGLEKDEPFLRLILGESLLARGSGGARVELERAVATLPKPEVLLRARAEALLGKACEEAGDFEAALRHYQEALLGHPGVMRALDLSLPVHLEASGGEAATAAARYLRKSPRFQDRGAGFLLAVRESAGGLSATFSAPDGSLLARATAPPAPDPATAARILCRELHRRTFAARVNLAQTDISSLEGSNLVGETVREQLKDLFGPGKNQEENK